MTFRRLHAWEVTAAQARSIQQQLGAQVVREDDLGMVRSVAGIDAHFDEGAGLVHAAVVVLSFPGLAPLCRAVATRATVFPYRPGLLGFRAIPALLDALERLAQLPDLTLCHGHGVAHPRRFGLASHLGLITGIPTIGVANESLVGEYREPDTVKGAWNPLVDDGETVGAVVRTRPATRPLFVSIGHRVSLATAIAHTVACCPRYRTPEPIRAARRTATKR